MKHLNKVFIEGRLARDLEVIYNREGEGIAIAKGTIGNTQVRKTEAGWEESTNWIDFKAFGFLAQRFAESMQKGDLILLEGKLIQEKWQTKEGENRSRLVVIAVDGKITAKVRKDVNDNEEVEDDIEDDDVPF